MHEEITSFADGSHDVSAHSMPGWVVWRFTRPRRFDRTHRTRHRVRGTIQRRAEEIVHRGIDYNKVLAAIVLGIERTSEQDAGRADQRASRLEEQVATQRSHRRGDCASIGRNVRRLLGRVPHAQAAAEIEKLERHARTGKLAHKSRQTPERPAERG